MHARILAASLLLSGAALLPAQAQMQDLERALVQIQMRRGEMLDQQYQAMMEELRQRNAFTAQAQQSLQLMAQLRAAAPSGTKPSSVVLDAIPLFRQNDYRLEKEINSALMALQLRPTNARNGRTLQWDSNRNAPAAFYDGGVQALATLAQLDSAMAAVRSALDGIGATQQMFMLQLQRVSNKRNEAVSLVAELGKRFNTARRPLPDPRSLPPERAQQVLAIDAKMKALVDSLAQLDSRLAAAETQRMALTQRGANPAPDMIAVADAAIAALTAEREKQTRELNSLEQQRAILFMRQG